MAGHCGLLVLQLLLVSVAVTRANLVVEGSTTVVSLIEGKDKDPKYVLKNVYNSVLYCSMYSSNGSVLLNPEIKWYRDVNTTLDSRYEFVTKISENKKNFTSTLSVNKPENQFISNYTCVGTASGFSPAEGQARLESQPLMSFKVEGVVMSDVAVWPGNDVVMNCIVDGNPPGSIEWRRQKDDKVIGNGTSSIIIRNVNYEEDRGSYSCSSKNVHGENSAQIFLRVKHPQAYLPPLIIIIVEVVIIAIVVAVYEYFMYRKRQRAQAEGDAYKSD